MGYYIPGPRSFNSAFAREVLSGTKKLKKKNEIKFMGKLYDFPELRRAKLFDRYPEKDELLKHLPSGRTVQSISRRYLFNVSS